MPFCKISLIFLFSLLQYNFLRAAVLGIDFGGEYVKTAIVAPGSPFKILLDEHSKRKFPALVVFDSDDRLFGNNGVALSLRKTDSSYSFQRLLLGQSLESPSVNVFNSRYVGHELFSDKERGTVRVRSGENAGLPDSLSCEELVAMTLRYIRRLASTEVNSDVRDAVITVPSFFTQKQRQAMLDSAEIAGLNVLSLINENTAVALQYGIDLNYDVGKIERVAFYNMGSTKTEVTVVKYSAYSGHRNKTHGNFEILSTASDELLGGQDFDMILVEKFASEFSETLHKKGVFTSGEDIRDIPRSMAKLKNAAKKAKEVLSANKEAPCHIEGLYKDFDFHSRISRDEFQELATDLFDRAINPLKSALKDAKVKRTQLDALVIVGGASRIKLVREKLTDFFGRELSHNLNSDEAAALGSAFRAANISTTFRVRPIGMVDISHYPVGLRITDIPGDVAVDDLLSPTKAQFSKRSTLFVHKNKLEKRKSVTIPHDRDVFISMHYDSEKMLPKGVSKNLQTYTVTGLTKFAEANLERGKPKLSLSFELNGNGIVELIKAQASYIEEVQVKVPVKKKKGKKERPGNDENKSSDFVSKNMNKTENDSVEANQTKSDDKPTPSNGDITNESSVNDTQPIEEKFEYKTEEREINEILTIVREGPFDLKPMTFDQISKSQALLKSLDDRDQTTRNTAEALNSAESYIYKAREYLDSEHIETVTNENELNVFQMALSDAEEWLYQDDGVPASAAKYLDRLAELQSIGSPIFSRLNEFIIRPQYIKRARDFLAAAGLIETEIAKMDWISEEERNTFGVKISDFATWFDLRNEEQNTISPKDTPVLTSNDITKRIEIISDEAELLLKRPKPPPKLKLFNETSLNFTKKFREKKMNKTNDAADDSDSSKTEDLDLNTRDEGEPDKDILDDENVESDELADDHVKEEL